MAVALTYDKLDETQKKNAALINAALTKYGITNPYLRAGILAVVAKESAFTPIAEGYRYTIPRLRVVFSTERLQNKSNNDLIKLLKVQPANAGYGLKPADQGRATDGVACMVEHGAHETWVTRKRVMVTSIAGVDSIKILVGATTLCSPKKVALI